MAEDQDDNVLVGIDQNGNLAKIRTKWIPGPAAHYQAYLLADPTTGDLLRPASQADVADLGTALAAILAELAGKLEPSDLAALATAARQDAAKGVLDAILAALAPVATAAGVAEVRDRLPATPHIQPLTDAQLRAAPVAMEAAALPLPAGAGTEASLDAIANLLALIADLLPRLTSNRQAAVAIESGSVGLAASQTLATLSDMQRVGGQYVNGHALNSAGLAMLYQQLEVT